MAAAEELLALIDKEIPDGRKNLQENYMNLENVAKYCEDNYLKASVAQKAHALLETQNYTTHSLASVAYQINNLATNFLKLLDLQMNQLTDMESSVNHLNLMINVYKEKVARREIGVLTIGKMIAKPLAMKNGIIYPEHAQQPVRYTRKSIDYTALDGIGHGLRQGGTPRATRSLSVSSTASSSNNQPVAPKPPSAPVYQAGPRATGGGVSRASGGHYSSPGTPTPAPTTPTLHPQETLISAHPPPPDEDDFPEPFLALPASPPLPPPPSDEQPDHFDYMGVVSQPQDFDSAREGLTSTRDRKLSRTLTEDTYAVSSRSYDDPYAATGPLLLEQSSWIPQTYLEKVVAIYEYNGTKSDELTFVENAVIYVIHKNEDGWWEGTVDGRTGLFPYNYVEPCM